MTSNQAKTSNQVTSHQMTTSHPPATRLEVFAAYETHMQQRDLLISQRIGCSPAFWADMRERNLVSWEQMERKAMMTPPRLSPRQLAAQRQEVFAPGEYLRLSERPQSPAWTRADRPLWLTLILGGCVFFGERIPVVHDFLTSLFR